MVSEVEHYMVSEVEHYMVSEVQYYTGVSSGTLYGVSYET